MKLPSVPSNSLHLVSEDSDVLSNDNLRLEPYKWTGDRTPDSVVVGKVCIDDGFLSSKGNRLRGDDKVSIVPHVVLNSGDIGHVECISMADLSSRRIEKPREKSQIVRLVLVIHYDRSLTPLDCGRNLLVFLHPKYSRVYREGMWDVDKVLDTICDCIIKVMNKSKRMPTGLSVMSDTKRLSVTLLREAHIDVAVDLLHRVSFCRFRSDSGRPLSLRRNTNDPPLPVISPSMVGTLDATVLDQSLRELC